MDRLCERPGCSDTASVAYGMRPEDLVFWLDRLDAAARDGGVLCRRHADSMVVPRSWTLDDLRDPDLHLFRPPAADPSRRRSRRASAASTAAARRVEQLALGVDADVSVNEAADASNTDRSTATDIGPTDTATTDTATTDTATTDTATTAADPVEVDASGIEAWSPIFDSADDLDGLLDARSPLLARAFRGDDRPRA